MISVIAVASGLGSPSLLSDYKNVLTVFADTGGAPNQTHPDDIFQGCGLRTVTVEEIKSDDKVGKVN